MSESIAVSIKESSQTGEARRTALALATRIGLKEVERSNLGIVVTELASNLVQHAQGGVVLLRAIEYPVLGIEILSLDQGPGMANIDQCLQDGFSTAGTAGNGMGAIGRLSNLFEIYSVPGGGTAILAQIWSDSEPDSPKMGLEVGAVCLPQRGEEVSGDGWAYKNESHRHLLLVADGLGHGPAAADASTLAIRTFQEHHQRSPHAIVEAAHMALRSTRGAALAIAEIDVQQQSVRFAGVGNIAASVSSAAEQHNLVSYNGTVGHEVRKISEFTYPWYSTDGLLIMHSDGLSTQWRLDRYPGLRQKHSSLIAGVLYRDFYRDRDDVTVLVVREV